MKNRAVHVESTIIYNVMSATAKANIVALYLNAKYGILVHNMLG